MDRACSVVRPGRMLIATLAVGALTPPSLAPPIHYWRFEADPGYLVDSIGAADLISESGLPTQAALPDAGRGSAFADVVLDTESAADYGVGGLLKTTVAPPTGDFTIEVLAHFDAFVSSFGSHLAGPARTGQNSGICWTLEVRHDGLGGTQPGELVMLLVDGNLVSELVGSGIVIETGKDYSLAAIFRLGARSITFLVRNLTDAGPLQIVIAAHSAESLHEIADFGVGSFASITTLTMRGLIDEVRYSDSALAFADLLNPPPPCPGDIDNDGDTDVFDFGTFAGNFGQTVPIGTGGDLTADGTVDVFDFSIFASDFGCPS